MIDGLIQRGFDVRLSTRLGVSAGPLRVEGYEAWPANTLAFDELRRNLAVMAPDRVDSMPVVVFADGYRAADDAWATLNTLTYLPVEWVPLPAQLRASLRNRPRRLLVPSRWGRDVLLREGIESQYLPLGVDVDLFSPVDGAKRRQLRAELEMDADAFVVGVVAVNNDWHVNRKSLPELIAGFAEFRRRRSDAVLYLHTDARAVQWTGAMDLGPVVADLGIPADAIRVTAFDRYRLGLPLDELADIYRCFDVLLAPSAAEGFCVPLIEAQACGVPVIASTFSAQEELVGAGWTVRGQRRWFPESGSWLFTPDVSAIASALDSAYLTRGEHTEEARTCALRFERRSLFECEWLPLISAMAEATTDPIA